MKRLMGCIVLFVSSSVIMASCAFSAPVARTLSPLTPASAATEPPVVAAWNNPPSTWQDIEQAGRREGLVVLYDSAYLAGDSGRAVAKAFKDKYGISLQVVVWGSSSATIDRLRAEKRAGLAVADVLNTSSASGPNLVSLGLVRKGLDRELPALQDKGAFIVDPAYSPEGEEVAIGYTLVAPVVNKNLVKKDDIRSFRDFLGPKWAGKMVMRDPRLGVGLESLFVAAMRLSNTIDDDYFTSLGKQKVLLTNSGEEEIAQMVARGDLPAALVGPVSTAYAPLIRDGAPLQVINPAEGAVALTEISQASVVAPHPNASRVFLNWILSSEGQTVFHKAQATESFRRDVAGSGSLNLGMDPIKKLVPTTWEVAIKAAADVKDGTMERFFGKR